MAGVRLRKGLGQTLLRDRRRTIGDVKKGFSTAGKDCSFGPSMEPR